MSLSSIKIGHRDGQHEIFASEATTRKVIGKSETTGY